MGCLIFNKQYKYNKNPSNINKNAHFCFFQLTTALRLNTTLKLIENRNQISLLITWQFSAKNKEKQFLL